MIQIDSISDLEKMEHAIAQHDLLKNDFAISELTKIVNAEIMDSIHDRMRSANYSKKIIHSTYLKEIIINGNDEAEIYIVSDYRSESGYNVSDGMEYGTKRNYPILPKQDRSNPSLSFVVNGERVFAKKVTHLGQRGTHILIDTIVEKSEALTAKYYLQEQEWLAQLLS